MAVPRRRRSQVRKGVVKERFEWGLKKARICPRAKGERKGVGGPRVGRELGSVLQTGGGGYPASSQPSHLLSQGFPWSGGRG